ncbi:MACPF domain-containing protein 2 [Plakobranchus ocellatus]|uniref:MACPF domain-containing protein 2 n=1 Tax=Plakobranchus ocellatus TaxID=259542 RepID=A0AAV3ZLC2_9GAST|nr:MACPF domain-containing protein 2 [Plakobranchus ocellatus]
MPLSIPRRVLLLLSVLCFSGGDSFILDDVSDVSSSFQLTFSPSLVKRGITRNVSLVCEHDGKTLPQFQEISRIRIMEQTPSGWDLLAQRTLTNNTRITDSNVFHVGTIARNINDTVLQISWALASQDTFGTYRCDVIGFDKNQDVVSESTAAITLPEQPATINDVLDLLLETRKELSELNRDVNHHLDAIDREVSGLKDEALTQKSVAAWPEGNYALLQPKTGCPVDLTFLGGDSSYFTVHTESSSGPKNENSYSKAFPLSTVTKLNTNTILYTLRFCEARRQFNTNRWPGGSYCINKISGLPCPSGFDQGYVELDVEDTNTTSDLRGNVVAEFGDKAKLEFCCKDTGSAGYRMRLPTHSPFLLYRKGGTCQKVWGMKASQESMTIDTENSNNGDMVAGSIPDISLLNTSGKPIIFSLCYYTKA